MICASFSPDITSNFIPVSSKIRFNNTSESLIFLIAEVAYAKNESTSLMSINNLNALNDFINLFVLELDNVDFENES